MKSFEEETGKKAIWKGKITETFKKWRRGETIYEINQERIGILVNPETKQEWQNFAEREDFPTISKLIRHAVNNYIKETPVDLTSKDLTEFSENIKRILTPIRLDSEFILKYHEKLEENDILKKVEEIFNQSKSLELHLNQFLKEKEIQKQKYDVLVIEDDKPTLELILDFFKLKGYTCRGVSSGKDGLEELQTSIPNLVLLDIILPDIDGYEICKRIREDNRLNNIRIVYITAKSEEEVRKKIKETGADGVIPKPFELSKVELLEEYLE